MHTTLRTLVPAASVAAVLLAAWPGEGRDQDGEFNATFAVLPPRVLSNSVRLLDRPTDAGNAVLTVRYAPDRRLSPTLTITPDSTPVVLHDDGREPDTRAGDLTYSGFVKVNREELARTQRRLAEAAVRSPVVPQFRGRVLAGRISTLQLLRADEAVVRGAIPLPYFGIYTAVNPARSLMVRDPAVISDPTRTVNPCTGAGNPNGKWTFNYLMTQMANQPASGVTPAAFVDKWLQLWTVPQTVNGWTVAARGNVAQIIAAWPKLPTGELNLQRAPFRLIAIVNRVDLRTNATYGGGAAGEGRFVFEAVDSKCQARPFTVILEYGVPLRRCPDVQAYGQAWFNLGSITPGTPSYNVRLEQLTDVFTKAGAGVGRPNGSAINQVRTNEIALASPWQLREFSLGRGANVLSETTVKQTPDISLDFTQTFANFVNANASGILSNAYTVPAQFQGAHFLGADAPAPSATLFWDGPGVHPSAQITTPGTRFGASLGTCNGCHAGETATPFEHLGTFSGPGGISGFLTGETVTDPAGEKTGSQPTTRAFNDLQRRAQDLDALVNSSCLAQIAFDPLRMVH